MRARRMRDRSYAVEREIPVGSRVSLIEPTIHWGHVPAGTTGILRSYTNAGFRGIEASIELDPPVRVIDPSGAPRVLHYLTGESAGNLRQL